MGVWNWGTGYTKHHPKITTFFLIMAAMKTSIGIGGLYTRFQANPYEVLWYPMMTLFVKQVWPFQLIHLPFTQAQVVAQKIHDLWQSQIPNDHRQRHEVAHRGKVEGEQVDLSGSTEHWDPPLREPLNSSIHSFF